LKKILAIIGVTLAAFACTPTLEPENPGSSQTDEILVQSVVEIPKETDPCCHEGVIFERILRITPYKSYLCGIEYNALKCVFYKPPVSYFL